MHTVSVSKTVGTSRDEVWPVLDDFGGVSKYNPNVKVSGIIDGPDTGEGATRECVFSDGGRIEERIIEYEPESSYIVDFIDVGEMPLKKNIVAVSVEEAGENETTVTMTATFTPKYGPVGWVIAKTMMKSKFRETFEEVLDGLESHVLSRPQMEDGDVSAEVASE